jgi:hypothetical protein
MELNLIQKRVLGIAVTSFYKERRKDIKESPAQASCLGTSEKKNIHHNNYLYIVYKNLFSNIFTVLN